jgi:hypothetical protein
MQIDDVFVVACWHRHSSVTETRDTHLAIAMNSEIVVGNGQYIMDGKWGWFIHHASKHGRIGGN